MKGNFLKVVLIATILFVASHAAKCGKSGADMRDSTMIAIVKSFIKRNPAIAVLPGRSNQLRFFHTIRGARRKLQILVINLGDKKAKYSNAKMLAAARRVIACDDDSLTKGGWFRFGSMEYNFDPKSL